MTLNEVYLEKIEIANKDVGICEFIFSFDNQKYLVTWQRGLTLKWSEPIKIIEL